MSARRTAQMAAGMNRPMNPFDPIDPSMLTAAGVEELAYAPV